MRRIVQAFGVMVWLTVAGTGIEAVTSPLAKAAPDDECILIDGVWHCPCPEETLTECAPPECILIDGVWYCP